eukprot:GSChrysophyteH1.ASY1.ANO1.2425.1 assembled CDS
MSLVHRIVFLLGILGFLCGSAAVEDPVSFVNLLAGSFTDGNTFSTGNTLPLVGYPWGFNHWSPQTRENSRGVGSWWFRGSEHRFTWLRSTMKPNYFDANLAPQNIRVELTPSMHGAMLRVTFPEHKDSKRICFTGQGAEWTEQGLSDTRPYIVGRANQSDDAVKVLNFHDVRCFDYADTATVVTVYMATSMISDQQAIINLNRELRYYGRNQFDIVLKHATNTWNNLLGRVEVVDPGPVTGSHTKQLSVFYTSLWRALTFPRRTDEVDISGNILHYSPYSPNGGVYRGPGATDNGFWDTFRTVYPMLSLLYPDHLSEIVTAWLSAYREGGWLPSWASPGYRNCMVGTFADVVVADAIVKGIKGIDIEVAKGAIHKDSFVTPPAFAGNAIGKDGLDEYSKRGYISSNPMNEGVECVSRSLDFGFADSAVANAFKRRELIEWSETLTRRANAVINGLFSEKAGLFVPKTALGKVSDRWSPIEWGRGYTEGNAWHHSFPPYAVTADGDGGLLAKLHGGRKKMLAKLHEMLDTPGYFRPGSYGQEIHEMVEARAVAMGQYAHNNQPVHHILWLFALLGDRKTTEEKIRFVLHHAYGEDFYAGDEDNGEQGAWYVLSALGLFSTTPGTPDYVAGSPIFRHVRIHRTPEPMPSPSISGNGAVGEFTDIVALGTSDVDMHVSKISWNGDSLPDNMFRGTETVPAVIHNSLLMKDGVLRFYMKGETDVAFDRSGASESGAKEKQQQPAKDTTKSSSSSIVSDRGGVAATQMQLDADRREIEDLRKSLLQARNQVTLQKTVVSQLQEKLTGAGLSGHVNMTHLAVTAANHHGLSEDLLLEASELFRKVDHTQNDELLHEHMLLALVVIFTVVMVILRVFLKRNGVVSTSGALQATHTPVQSRVQKGGDESSPRERQRRKD